VTPLQRWEKRAEWPLAACAVAFLVFFSVEVLAQPRGREETFVSWAQHLLYVPFVVDYVVRLWLAEDRPRWFITHPLDLAVATLPFLGPLRFLRLVALIRILQRALGDAVRGRVIAFSALGAVLLVYVAALAALKYERNAPDSQITNFPDALWWAVATLTTVGYGDHTPVTHAGRAVAVLLMIGGICLLGAATATVASWIISEVAKAEGAEQAATVAHVDELRAEIRSLQQLVQEGIHTPSAPGAHTPSAPGVPSPRG